MDDTTVLIVRSLCSVAFSAVCIWVVGSFFHEVLEKTEYFGDAHEVFGFQHATVIFKSRGAIQYRGLSKHRYRSNSEVERSHLTDTIPIPPKDYCPIFQSNFTRAPDSLLANSYIKRPRLSNYRSRYPTEISEQVRREVEVCELLRSKPHPNLAQYHGCEVRDGLITGLCFTKYNRTLLERVNPKFFGKHSPPSNGLVSSEDLRPWLDGVEHGIQHLHKLGLIHNDLNPSNIMFDSDDHPVI
ncbi:hypothetical protein AJ80_08885 [Polytolypa hystricis UAMH7299]|uniref:Protein kinase domain-containing protein n=1 Tax=Polytolypa hystricis (strain UAMH7299) TaxID=1447883 RepID=A0A2B7X0A0_POLH7|nr:hypothetical protein AJ80_08885 [Polytolypa hystricis UAMH7299]